MSRTHGQEDPARGAAPTHDDLSCVARALLERARRTGGMFVRRAADVAAARALVRRGLAQLEDLGGSKLRDGERWWLTAART